MQKYFPNVLIAGLLIAITAIFFYPVFTRGKIPFPGDLLVAEYQPWRSYSHDGYVPGSVPNKAQYFDPMRQMYPWKTFAIQSIKNAELPIWNPYNFSGAPLLANFQSAVLYPLNIVYLLLQQDIAWTILVMVQPLFSLFVMVALTRRFGLSYPACFLAAISYAFSLFMTTFLEYNILGHYLYLVPLGMLAIEYITAGKRWAPILLSTTIAIAGFAGHAQLFAGTIGYLFIYLWLRVPQRIYILFILSGVAMSGIQILPGLELANLAARSAHEVSYFASNLLIRPEQLILFLVPDIFGNPATRNYVVPFSYPSKALYVGIAIIIMAGISLLHRPKSPEWHAVARMTLITALFIFLNPLIILIYQFNLPFLSSSSPSNFIFLISLGVCLLGGFGFEHLKTHKDKSHIYLLIFIWLVMGGTFLITQATHIQINTKNFIYSSAILSIVSLLVLTIRLSVKLKTIAIMGLLIVTAADLFYFFHKFNPFVPRSYLYPETTIISWLQQHAGINRFWGYGSGAIDANFSTQTGIYSTDGYDPLYPKYYGELIQTSNNGNFPKSFTDRTRSDAVIANGYGETDMTDNVFRLKILSLMGVKYIIDKVENGSTAKTFPPENFTNVATINDFRVLEYTKAAPRTFLTTSYKQYHSQQEAQHMLFDPMFNPQSAILLAENPNIDTTKQLTKKQTNIVHYSPTRVTIATENDSPALLYLSDTYYPGWQANIDGVPTHIYVANYAFRAVVVPNGIHRVEFVYAPTSLRYGGYLSVIGLLTTAILMIKKRYTKTA